MLHVTKGEMVVRAGYHPCLFRAAGDLGCECERSILVLVKMDTLVINGCAEIILYSMELYPAERHHIVLRCRWVAFTIGWLVVGRGGRPRIPRRRAWVFFLSQSSDLFFPFVVVLVERIFRLSIVRGVFYSCEIRALFLFADVLVTLSVSWCVPTLSCNLAISGLLVRTSFVLSLLKL